ncbi:hypothetical protein MMARJ_23280 [Mycobacterium marseillense]|uniref:Uncharacterized protein n=1 Tax=Mycobacterium marseillense TaxID=701042 RepID=A0ABN5ZV85_9MYCO|nr:hypothetical protein MMARJ_23280 [Mycobacterium marseillense]
MLSPALVGEVVAAEHSPADLLGLTLHALDGALHRFLRPALLVPHGSTSLSVVSELALDGTYGVPAASRAKRPVWRRAWTAPKVCG